MLHLLQISQIYSPFFPEYLCFCIDNVDNKALFNF